MQTVIGNTHEKNVRATEFVHRALVVKHVDAPLTRQVQDLTMQQAEELERARQANAAFVQRMKHVSEHAGDHATGR